MKFHEAHDAISKQIESFKLNRNEYYYYNSVFGNPKLTLFIFKI